MLVLSRKPNESIHIGNDITVTVVRISDNTVRLGITAPESVPIHRDDAVEHEPKIKPEWIANSPEDIN